MILGTAGHIDHGKTTLVRALTGVDTDRLPEEKKRGITIDLGFAPLRLDGVGTLGVVDVPGHEAFVRTMVAGATGIDLALVVVAADEGVMPQTREHLSIIQLLGVTNGVIALTKCDLVDDDWVALVREDVRAASARALPNAPLVATSALTGRGLEDLRAALAHAASRIETRARGDLLRLPVDRAFTIRGTGTVVTGTVWTGAVAREEIVRVLPGTRTARVRGLQEHGAEAESVAAGARAAVALASVEVADVPRGSTLVTDRSWQPSKRFRAEITVVDGAPVVFRPRTRLRLHVGTSEVGARVVAAGASASTFAARVVLDSPVVLRAGDRFVLRTSAPLNTIAGGVVVDPYAPRRAKPWPVDLSDEDRLERMLDEAGGQGIDPTTLPVRLGLAPSACRRLVEQLPAATAVGGRLLSPEKVGTIARDILAAIRSHHAECPLEPGLPVQSLRDSLHAPLEVVDALVEREARSGAISVKSGVAALKGWAPKASGDASERAHGVLARLIEAGAEPPTREELAVQFGAGTGDVLRFLERQGDVVQVESNRYYAAAPLKSIVDRLRDLMADGKELSPAEVRDGLGLSRKYLIPFLEYCDRVGYTIRRANGRVWKGS